MYVLARAVEDLTPMLDSSKTAGFKAILCCKSSANLGWMNFLLVEKLNDDSLLIARGTGQNVQLTCPSAQYERLLSEREERTNLYLDHMFIYS
jgi:hypothetical protein